MQFTVENVKAHWFKQFNIFNIKDAMIRIYAKFYSKIKKIK